MLKDPANVYGSFVEQVPNQNEDEIGFTESTDLDAILREIASATEGELYSDDFSSHLFKRQANDIIGDDDGPLSSLLKVAVGVFPRRDSITEELQFRIGMTGEEYVRNLQDLLDKLKTEGKYFWRYSPLVQLNADATITIIPRGTALLQDAVYRVVISQSKELAELTSWGTRTELTIDTLNTRGVTGGEWKTKTDVPTDRLNEYAELFCIANGVQLANDDRLSYFDSVGNTQVVCFIKGKKLKSIPFKLDVAASSFDVEFYDVLQNQVEFKESFPIYILLKIIDYHKL